MKESGMIGAFATAEGVTAAAQGAAAAGFPHWETFTPFAIEELTEERSPATGHSAVARAMAMGGAVGAGGAFGMQYFATHIYPIDVGSRPLNSWPAFIPITFELGVLCAALTGVATMLVLNGLPRLHHPVFSAVEFRRASQDRFFLLLYSDHPGFKVDEARAYLHRSGAGVVEEVDE